MKYICTNTESTMNKQSGITRTLLIAVALTITVAVLTWNQLPSRCLDSGWYQMMASGDGTGVPRPFANRILHTGLAGDVMKINGCEVNTAFLALGLISTFVLLMSLLLLLRELAPSRLLVVIFFSPLLIFLFRDNSLPDLFHAALTALTFLALRRHPLLALPLLILLGMTRESSFLFAVVLAVILWRDGRRFLSPAVMATTIGGMALAWSLSGAGETTNVHQIAAPLYLLLKVPFNLCRNVLGLELWVNTIDYCDPALTWQLPARLGRGIVETIGFCGLNALRPVFLATLTFATFGILPGLLWGFRKRSRHLIPHEAPLWIRVALYYGLASLLLTPALGAATDRLLGYAWPAFWLATPWLLQSMIRELPDRSRALGRLVILHLVCGWMLLLIQAAPESIVLLSGYFVSALAMNFTAYRIILAKPELKVMYASG